MPISRYLNYQLFIRNFDDPMQKLISSFNPAAVKNVICRNTISISFFGYLCHFDSSKMLDELVSAESCRHLRPFEIFLLNNRNIINKLYCYGYTTREGSSCSGTVIK